MRNALLIVRAGDRSLHPAWLKGRGSGERRFDLHISYFGDKADAFADRPADVTLSFEKGGKWTGLTACLETLGDRVLQYDWIGFPDDDLIADCRTWNRFFDILDEMQPKLAQPALHWRSFVTWDFLIQRIGVKARWTNFVEIMTPVMSRDFFLKVRGALGANASGYGYDFWWPTLAEPKARSVLVVDAAPVLHTRKPLSGGLHAVLQAKGQDVMGERDAFFAEHGGGEYPLQAYSVIPLVGGERPGRASDHRRHTVSKRLRHWRNRRGVTEISR
ncbi:MAG TPA: hypothetical protein VD906_07155 [Caulobacteraceae bacterium]|nr:hypothetical protein [Caulobacteraceae bacterium]